MLTPSFRAGCAVINGEVIIAGGLRNSAYLDSSEIINLSTRTVRYGGNLLQARFDHKMFLLGSSLLVIGQEAMQKNELHLEELLHGSTLILTPLRFGML